MIHALEFTNYIPRSCAKQQMNYIVAGRNKILHMLVLLVRKVYLGNGMSEIQSVIGSEISCHCDLIGGLSCQLLAYQSVTIT